jgi:hydroxymethylpyrimidine/phosphomethylpyrimidine kinase
MKGRVLICAGSDSGGGAGIQADIKAVMALGGYAMTAITALTAQDTRGVQGVVGVAPDFIALQMRVCLDDIGADAIKTGMLADSATIEAVCSVLKTHGSGIPLVCDPVMVAKGGARLLADDAIETLPDVAAMREAAEMMLTLGVPAVLLKGGHGEGEMLTDLLATEQGVELFESPRIPTRHTHGTGCTLASAIATGLAQKLPLREAVIRARGYVRAALLAAPGYGHGHGPLNHGVTINQAKLAGFV